MHNRSAGKCFFQGFPPSDCATVCAYFVLPFKITSYSSITSFSTSLHFDDFMIGQRAAEMILRLTNGDEVEKEVIDEYEVIIKGSTK